MFDFFKFFLYFTRPWLYHWRPSSSLLHVPDVSAATCLCYIQIHLQPDQERSSHQHGWPPGQLGVDFSATAKGWGKTKSWVSEVCSLSRLCLLPRGGGVWWPLSRWLCNLPPDLRPHACCAVWPLEGHRPIQQLSKPISWASRKVVHK